MLEYFTSLSFLNYLVIIYHKCIYDLQISQLFNIKMKVCKNIGKTDFINSCDLLAVAV